MPFKKVTDDGVLLAPNFVHAPTFLLIEETKDLAPIDGWEWISEEEYPILEETQKEEIAEAGYEPE